MADAIENAARNTSYVIDPENLTIVSDPAHPLYDERINLPLDENMIKNIMVHGVLQTINCRRTKEGTIEVVDGRRRVRHAIEANKRLREMGEPPKLVTMKMERGADVEMFGKTVTLNEYRVDDDVLTRAGKAARLLAGGKSEAEIAVHFGTNTATIHNWLNILEGSAALKKALSSGLISVSAAAELAKLPKKEQDEAIQKLKEEVKDATTMDGRQKKISVRKAKHTVSGTIIKPGGKDIRTALTLMEKEDEEGAKLLRWILGEISSKDVFGVDVTEVRLKTKREEAERKKQEKENKKADKAAKKEEKEAKKAARIAKKEEKEKAKIERQERKAERQKAAEEKKAEKAAKAEAKEKKAEKAPKKSKSKK